MLSFKHILILLFCITCFAGCKFYSFTGASIPPQAKTFSVRHFPNHAQIIQPTLSQRFTESLQDKFTTQTRLSLTDGKGDLHFEGSITGYTTQPTAISGDDQAALNRLTVTVRVVFINEYDPKGDFERSFARYFDYDSRRSLSEVEDQALTEIIEALVDDIFNAAVVNW
jgi:hypothetical protein